MLKVKIMQMRFFLIAMMLSNTFLASSSKISQRDHFTTSSFFSLMPLFSVIPFIKIYTKVKKSEPGGWGGRGRSVTAVILASNYDRFDSMQVETLSLSFCFSCSIRFY